MDKVIIIPATKIKIKLIIVSVINFLKKIKASIAPNGSARPDKKVFFIASFLEPVA